MKIGVIGGGPAGLYFSILMKLARPGAQITVVERNPRDVTWGWGVVFSDETLRNFLDADPATHAAIEGQFARWDAIDVYFKGRRIRSGGHGFCGIRRMKLLQILQARAEELGVEMEFGVEMDSEARFSDCDLIVAADGINSAIRTKYAEHFKPDIEVGKAKFIWLGSTKPFEAFTFYIRENEHGMFQVHAYQFDEDNSTFIVECDEQTWRNAGLDRMDEAQSIAYCEQVFAEDLQGHRLLGNHSQWINFRRIKNEAWFKDNIVLLGDAAHTAHFSIGSGTKLAMEDCISLVEAMKAHPDDVKAALQAYYDERWLPVAKLQRAAAVSRHWFEDIGRYREFEPEQFTISLMSRSKRVTHENLRRRDPEYIAAVDRWWARKHGWDESAGAEPPPPMFTPFSLRGMTVRNRVVVSPMCQYSAQEGLINDWHLVHLGSLAKGGAGLVFTEMTDVSAEGRLSHGCAGMYTEAHRDAWRRVVDFVHAHSRAKIAMQLGHAGRKGATQRPWEPGGDIPLKEGAWPLLAPSAIPWDESSQVPKAMDRADMDLVRDQFVRATRWALEAGFDMIELHGAHGYLFSAFISPLSNRREDEYGGGIENRMRYPLEVFDAMRAVWPEDRPMSVRVSATDWHPDGLTAEESVAVAQMFAEHGADLIDVSAGGTTPDADPVYGRMFQTPFADRIRNEAGIATMAVGNIQDWDQVNTIVVSGRADLCALARPHLYDPCFTLHAAAEQGVYAGEPIPDQYRSTRHIAQRIFDERQGIKDK